MVKDEHMGGLSNGPLPTSTYPKQLVFSVHIYLANVAITQVTVPKLSNRFKFLLLDEAVASRAVFVIVSGSERWAEMLLEPAK